MPTLADRLRPLVDHPYSDYVFDTIAEIEALVAEADSLTRSHAAALALLRELEWRAPLGNHLARCPVCGQPPHRGHDAGCRLAAVLKAETAAMETT